MSIPHENRFGIHFEVKEYPQSHRLFEAGRHLWKSSDPIPLLRARSARASYSGLCPV